MVIAHRNRHKDYAGTEEEICVVKALPHRISPALRIGIECHLSLPRGVNDGPYEATQMIMWELYLPQCQTRTCEGIEGISWCTSPI